MSTVAIIGASCYTGQEVLDRVLAHPELELVALGSDGLAGRPGAVLDPRLARRDGLLPAFVPNAEAAESDADVLFLCLGHEEAAAFAPAAGTGIVIDLSGAHRLPSASAYADWYGFDHPRPDELARWSYALPELWPPAGRHVANPGCYATAALLSLAPLRDLVEPTGVVVDGKSGVSGAGRTPRAASHAGVVLENVSPYRVGNHQHTPEIEQMLGFAVCFVPHLLPVRRGLIATCYVQPLPGADLRGALEETYAGSDVVCLLPAGTAPELGRVQGTDAAELGIFDDRATGRAIIVCALDNLGKGAAGQAVQSANLLLDLHETAGLRLAGVLV
jgi:N-acetyl-gamma-glutamyl-phosphate reductase